jgi:hypothetical protein
MADTGRFEALELCPSGFQVVVHPVGGAYKHYVLLLSCNAHAGEVSVGETWRPECATEQQAKPNAEHRTQNDEHCPESAGSLYL